MHRIASAVLLMATLLAACGRSAEPAAVGDGLPAGVPVKTSAGQYFNLEVDQIEPLLDNDGVFTVNVHIPYAGDLPGTDAEVPFNEVEQQMDKFPTEKDAPIVVYCRSGNMSAQASETLAAMGYTNVFNVLGGMAAWQQAGNDLVTR